MSFVFQGDSWIAFVAGKIGDKLTGQIFDNGKTHVFKRLPLRHCNGYQFLRVVRGKKCYTMPLYQMRQLERIKRHERNYEI